MKKLIPILLAVFALVSCEKDPDMDKLDNEYLVFTSHDTSIIRKSKCSRVSK